MRRLLFIVIAAMGMFKGHSQALVQTYTDRCTGEVKVFSVDMNGSTVVAYYNRSRVFTAAEFMNGTLQAWLEETYAWWQALSPCSTGNATNNTTQQTTTNATTNATNAANNATSGATSNATGSTGTTGTTGTTNTGSTNTGSTNTNTNGNTGSTSGSSGSSSGNGSSSSSSGSSSGSSSSGSSGGDSSNSGSSGGDSGSSSSSSNSSGGDSGSTSNDNSGGDNSGDSGNGDSGGDSSSSGDEGSSGDNSSDNDNSSSDSDNSSGDGDSGDDNSSGEEGGDSSEESGEGNEDSSNEESSEESSDESSEETSEEESKEESEEVEEDEQTEEESDESSEEESEEESDEEESSDEESEEDEEEDSEEESNDEGEEEDDEEEEERKLAPPIVTANLVTMQMIDGVLTNAASFGYSQSSLTGETTYAANAMVWSNLKQYSINLSQSQVFFNWDKEVPIMILDPDTGDYFKFGSYKDRGTIMMVQSISAGYMRMFSTHIATVGLSNVYMGQKENFWKGFVGGYAMTGMGVFLEGGNVVTTAAFTAFGTKPFNFKKFDRLTVSPMLAYSMTPATYDFESNKITWSSHGTWIVGSNFDFNLTQRFKANIGGTLIGNTMPQMPLSWALTVGSRFQF